MIALVTFAEAGGPLIWLVVFGLALAAEVIDGRGWAIWGAGGAIVAAILTAWLHLDPAIAGLALIAATALGVGYGLRARSLSADTRPRPLLCRRRHEP